jgi:hypothetical protein
LTCWVAFRQVIEIEVFNRHGLVRGIGVLLFIIRGLSNPNMLLVSVYPSMKIKGAEKGIVPVLRFYCLKEKNQNKINSYHWFFNTFGPAVQCVRSARRWYNGQRHLNLLALGSLTLAAKLSS